MFSEKLNSHPTSSLEFLSNHPLLSEELGINLGTAQEVELFKWFLASILLGARISETIARNTYRTFEKYDLLTPYKIIEAGWDFLVNPIMREGGYVRYDYKTSTKLLKICNRLISTYRGKVARIHEDAKDSANLEHRLLEFYGVGSVTSNIFLRELRPYWEKSNPAPLPIVIDIAAKIGLDLSQFDRKSITFARIEAGLIKIRNKFRKNGTFNR